MLLFLFGLSAHFFDETVVYNVVQRPAGFVKAGFFVTDDYKYTEKFERRK